MRPASASSKAKEVSSIITTAAAIIIPVIFGHAARIGVAERIVCDYKTSTIHRESPHKSTHEQNQRQHQ